MRLAPPPLGLYVHLPWCVRKCPYCDFNSHEARGDIPVDAYTDALLLDLERELARAGDRSIESVFIGGGTPSLFPPAAIARILDAAGARLQAGAEVTLEANPGTLEQGRFAAYREAGVNRLSIGVQSFQPHLLRRIGRIHGPAEARRAVEAARTAGFRQFNLDLMFALPGQTLAEAVADVDTAIGLGAPHVSHYQLTLEPNTVFHSKPPALPDEDLAWDMQQACTRRLGQAGLRRYEVSAWARPGQACRHNLNYWRFGDYLAIGAGAHGKLTDTASGRILRYRKARVPAIYMGHSAAGRPDVEHREVAHGERPLEFLMNALRLTEGFSIEGFESTTGMPWSDVAPLAEAAYREGLLETTADGYRASRDGMNHLDGLLQRFLPEADR